ncbi:MAG: hypothetical protein P9X24_13600, partial [Candidatus Hatepunaea meridiana]|nr:hypothetical protein [Candidatus Hatepunaea meridiana]
VIAIGLNWGKMIKLILEWALNDGYKRGADIPVPPPPDYTITQRNTTLSYAPAWERIPYHLVIPQITLYIPTLESGNELKLQA